jgi:hypothetical protein
MFAGPLDFDFQSPIQCVRLNGVFTHILRLVLLFLLFVAWKVASVNDHDGRSL